MFEPFRKSVRAAIVVVMTSLLVVSCGSVSKDYDYIAEEAPKWEDNYSAGEHPSERTGEYAIKLQTCPTAEKVEEFITTFYNPEHATLASRTLGQNAYFEGGFARPVDDGRINHYDYETVIGTMNVKCLPSLDGSIEYRPLKGNEELQNQWFNFQGTYALAMSNFRQKLNDLAEERGGKFTFAMPLTLHNLSDEDYEEVMKEAMNTPEYRLMVDYNYSLQLLGIVSALSGGMLFDSYSNPAMGEEESTIFDNSRNWSWSTVPVLKNNRIEVAYTGQYEDGTAPREPEIELFW